MSQGNSCGEEIVWIKTPSGKNTPMNRRAVRVWLLWVSIVAGLWLVTCPGSSGAAPCRPTEAQVRRVIVKMGEGRMSRRRIVARQLAPSILREAKRWSMHPATLLAIASTESDFRARLRGRVRPGSRRSAEVGVYQLIPGDSPIRSQRVWIDQVCSRPNPQAHLCPRDIWARKRRRGRFTVRQLGDPYLGSYLVAGEIQVHGNHCAQRRPTGHVTPWVRRWARKHRVAMTRARNLSRLGHYNTGPRWRSPARLKKFRWYVRRLLRRWAKIRRLLGCATLKVARRTRP